MSESQSYSRHARFDPPFHYVLLPLLLADMVFAIYSTVRHWPEHRELSLWWIVMSFALLLLAGTSRASALRAQDRLIRLEERLRCAALLPSSELERTHTLS